MLYKPTFCCECGNKIERTNWKFWTSRRFCENCEADFRKEEWLPTAVLSLIALVGGLFGFGSYLKTPEKPLTLTSNRTASVSADKAQNKNTLNNANANSAKIVQPISVNSNQIAVIKSVPVAPNLIKAADLQNTAEDPVYFCGAQTKKGMPCSRKVKGGGRCWQHTGQPAMLPKDKLVAGR